MGLERNGEKGLVTRPRRASDSLLSSEALVRLGQLSDKAGACPVPKVCQNAMFFGLLRLASSEKQVPQLVENTEK